MYKLWLYLIIIETLVILFVIFMYFVITLDSDYIPNHEWELLVQVAFTLLFILVFIIGVVIAVIYTKTMEFQIYDNEVVVRKGVINKTEKHVPYRTVTNISTRYGIFDKIFGIGTVEIETAGKSGQSTGPEEKIEGIPNYIEMRNTILEELRKFRSQYTTATEPAVEKTSEDNLSSSILAELRAIRNLLQNQQ